ncbi:MAG: hypothetical protein Kow0029_30850 [Candidatus Rifleibacteriota bacterium]
MSEKFHGANQTLEQLISVLPGEKKYELDGAQIIIHAVVYDKLLKVKKENSYLIEKLSNTPVGQAHKQLVPELPDAYIFTRVVQNGVELLPFQVREFNLSAVYQISAAFPETARPQSPSGWLPIENNLNSDVNPGLKVFTCTNCYKISNNSSTPCSNCATPMAPMEGYLCPKCSKTQKDYNKGVCAFCGTYFLSKPSKAKKVVVLGANQKPVLAIPDDLNTDLNPALQVYTCKVCYKISANEKCSASPTCEMVKPVKGYFCHCCERPQQKFNSGYCEKCGHSLAGLK